MTVYIDIFFLNNFIIDLFLLLISGKCFKRILNFKRLLFASILGGVYSVLAFINVFMFLNSFIVKTFVSCLMVVISFKLSFKEFLKQLLAFYFCSFILAGIIVALSLSKGESVMIFNNSMYFKIPFLNLVLSGVIMSAFVFEIFTKMVKKHNFKDAYKTVKISSGYKKVKVTGYIDTGNTLKFFGLPVCILDLEVAKKLNPEYICEIPCYTVNGFKFLKAFCPEYVFLDTKQVRMLIAVSDTVLGEDYKMLINSEFLSEGGFKGDESMAVKKI